MPVAWLTRVVTPQSCIRPGSQKRQVPAGGALPRRFVSPRGRVRHALSVGREQPRRVPAFGTRVWPDVTAGHVSLVLRFLGRVPRNHCTTVVQFYSTSMEADPADLDASRGMVRREPGPVTAHTGLCVCGDETQEQQRTVSSRTLLSDERTRGGSHAADADILWKKLARRTYPHVRGDTTKGRGKARLDGRQGYPLACHAARARLGSLRAPR